MANALKIQNTKFNPLGLIPNPSPKGEGLLHSVLILNFYFIYSLILWTLMQLNVKFASPSSRERD